MRAFQYTTLIGTFRYFYNSQLGCTHAGLNSVFTVLIMRILPMFSTRRFQSVGSVKVNKASHLPI